jgi:putative DNA primase/helicase
MKYSDIVDYLVSTAGQSFDSFGLSDDRVNKKTEAGIAIAMRRYICGIDGDDGNDFFKVDDDGLLYVYNGQYFEQMLEETLLEIIIEVLERSNVGIVYQTGSAKIIKEYCLNRLKGDERCKFVADRRYICFKNGVFDLQQMKLVPFSVKYKTDIILDFDYIANVHSALWDKVLAQTVPDENMRETLHQYCGCFLANRNEYKIEYICFVVGEGQNGKSIICKAVVNMLGPNVASSYSPEQLFKSSQMEYHLADVNGKIVNYCDEVSNKDFSGGDFKQFVSGGAFTGRHPYSKRPTKVDKIPLMLCCANKIPPTTDDTEGYFRRFLIILAPNHIDDRDKDPMLEMKLKAPEVKAAIFNWVLEGYKTFMKNDGKIEIASSVKEVVDEMKANSNSLRRWIDTMGYVAAQPEDKRAPGWKSLKEWVQLYKAYCDDWGETPRSRSAVTEQFKKMNAVSERRSDGIWYYLEVAPVETVKSEPVVEEKKEVEEDLPFS